MRLRTPLLLLSFVLLGLHPRAFGETDQPGNDDAPKRSKVSCARLRQRMERDAKNLGLDDKITPKSWGNIPDELRKLPPGAELCGVDTELEHVVITSALFGKDLESYYAPLFAKIGCRPLGCTVETGFVDQTRCRCATEGVVGTVATDVKDEAFTLKVSK
jgi:hypothetical protein